MIMDSVRCPACRGAKKVAKLGGMIGECNACSGEGKIKASDKPVSVSTPLCPPSDISLIQAVADSVPASSVTLCPPSVAGEEPVKIDRKKAVFKRKRTG